MPIDQTVGRFPFFMMAAVSHLGFLKVRNFTCPYGSEVQYASTCQISYRSVEQLSRYGQFQFFQDGGRRHLNVFARVWTTSEEYLEVFVILQNLVGIGAVVLIMRCT